MLDNKKDENELEELVTDLENKEKKKIFHSPLQT